MSVFELYRDDVKNRLSVYAFTETAIGSYTRVDFSANVSIDSVGDSGGNALFTYSGGLQLFVGQTMTISGFITNTDYNVTGIISVTNGTSDFEISGISFGTDEEVGEFDTTISEATKLKTEQAYRKIRENLVGTVQDVMFAITAAQRDALTSPNEILILEKDNSQIECYNGTDWEVVGGTEWIVRTSTTVQTTDATQTTIDSFTLDDEETYMVQISVVGTKDDGSDRAGAILSALLYRDGGSATIQGVVQSMLEVYSDSNWSIDITVSGNDVRASVTGLAATTINWKCSMQFIEQ